MSLFKIIDSTPLIILTAVIIYSCMGIYSNVMIINEKNTHARELYNQAKNNLKTKLLSLELPIENNQPHPEEYPCIANTEDGRNGICNEDRSHCVYLTEDEVLVAIGSPSVTTPDVDIYKRSNQNYLVTSFITLLCYAFFSYTREFVSRTL